jgi:hypothetical protein
VSSHRWECTRCQARTETYSPREDPPGWTWRLILGSVSLARLLPNKWEIRCITCEAKVPKKKRPDPPQEPGPMPW